MQTDFQDLKTQSDSQQALLVDIRRHLHQNPELSWNEIETSRFIKQKLRDSGLTVVEKLAETGFYTDIKGSHVGPLIAYRADMDALPIQDVKDVPYASSVVNVGHMCGHDYHSTVAVGLALLLHHNRDKICGTIRVFWQPAEESTPSGAPQMIKDGVLNNVKATFGIHCDPTLSSGKIAFRDGPTTASFDAFEIEIQSEDSIHSARPHTGQDTVWIAHQMVNNLYQLTSRITDSRSPSVIAVCVFNAGNALNIIPQKVSFGGTIRTSDEESRKKLTEHLVSLCNQFELLYKVKISLKLESGAPPVLNDKALYNFAKLRLAQAIGAEAIEYPEQSMGAEDFAYYSIKTPSLFIRVGTSNSPETSHALHTSKFDVDESTLSFAVNMQAVLMLSYLEANI
jgi:amidohydrolase